MSDLERDGPFDLKPSEVIEQMQRLGVHVSREQAVAFSSWAYSKFCAYRLENLPMTPSAQPPKTQG